MNVRQEVTLDFFNPKAGISFKPSPRHTVYASFSVANKEPNRDDYTESTPGSRPGAERLYDLEAGWKGRFNTGSAGLNFYLMSYRDQLILTGKINDVGRSEEHTSELQSLMRISYAVFCLKQKKKYKI